MPVHDFFHQAVKNALIKDGWTITHDPLTVLFGNINLHIDLGAERLLAAEKGSQRIAVEIKNFLSPSMVSEFHTALGQFLNYQIVLEENDPERRLYLAIPEDAYKEFFSMEITRKIIQRHQVKLIVFRPEQEVIAQWTK
ncbi:MAG: fatty-acid oxidation protein subunit alpha [Thiothrix nivea]|nr:MAG: fatty-acid oxidation protein subunit alpha [Thiothrix nivea]